LTGQAGDVLLVEAILIANVHRIPLFNGFMLVRKLRMSEMICLVRHIAVRNGDRGGKNDGKHDLMRRGLFDWYVRFPLH
jgi:hypothetical protein